jgi:hypothetical protein
MQFIGSWLSLSMAGVPHPRRKYLKRPMRLEFFQGGQKKSFSTQSAICRRSMALLGKLTLRPLETLAIF